MLCKSAINMDLQDLITQNRFRADSVFSNTNSALPASDYKFVRESDYHFDSKSIIEQYIPKQKRESPVITSIAPAPILDNRPQRAREIEATDIRVEKPHKKWYNYCVISGHNAFVNAVSVDISNEFFVTGSTDRMIKFWDLAKAEIKLTLTGHTGAVNDLQLSKRSPYLFSCCAAKQVYCWDLTRNAIIRNFFGHHSGVYCLDLHPKLDYFVTGSRDATARVWDIRSRESALVLEGHDGGIFDVIVQENQPNVITSSKDATIRLWDLRNGKQLGILTHHKKTIRAMAQHPVLWSFVSASPDAIFQWSGETAKFFKEFKSHNTIVTGLAINEDDVMVSVGDDGSLKFWDFQSGACFQETRTIPQPGSLESECGILDCSFDITGKRLITCEVDKTIKLWKEVSGD